MTNASSLLDLTRQFDRIDPADIDARLPLATQITTLLGDRFTDFEERYGRLVDARPEHESPAQTVLSEMGLAGVEHT